MLPILGPLSLLFSPGPLFICYYPLALLLELDLDPAPDLSPAPDPALFWPMVPLAAEKLSISFKYEILI